MRDPGRVTSRRRALLAGLLLLGVLACLLVMRERPWDAPAGQVPEQLPQAAVARFESLEGRVDRKTVATLEWARAAKGQDLQRQEMVRTGSDGLADIQFFEGAQLHLRPESLITLEEGSQEPATQRRRVAWRIAQGEASFKSAGREISVITTPRATVSAGQGSDLSVRVGPAEEFDLRVLGGATELKTQSGRSLKLSSGEAVKVGADGRLGPAHQLLAAPVLSSPPSGALISYRDPARGVTVLAWQRVREAVAYRVMLASDPGFVTTIVDRGGLSKTTFEARKLGLGAYRWRVTAVDAAGVEGRSSEAWPFSVGATGGRSYGPPPTLQIAQAELRRGMLRLSGLTDRGATLSVNGIGIAVEPNGHFNEYLLLATDEIVVRSTGVNGEVSELRRRVRLGS